MYESILTFTSFQAELAVNVTNTDGGPRAFATATAFSNFLRIYRGDPITVAGTVVTAPIVTPACFLFNCRCNA